MLDISNAKFAFLDIETTGLSPWFGDRICQIAIVVTEAIGQVSRPQMQIRNHRKLHGNAPSR